MSVASSNEGKKWIQASVALGCIFLGYSFIAFLEKLSEWFALESKIPFFYGLAQGLGVLTGLAVYIYLFKNPQTSAFLSDVYAEIMKVVWPDKNQTWKYTVVIMIGVTIMGFVFGFFDFGTTFLLNLINK